MRRRAFAKRRESEKTMSSGSRRGAWGWPSGAVQNAVAYVHAPELTDAARAEFESQVALRLPLAVVTVPRLTSNRIWDWLTSRRIAFDLARDDGRLRAALVAYGGVAVAFIDGTDEAIERRFSLAHEVGHFVAEYLAERSGIDRIGGTHMLEVHDGIRRATSGERLRFAVAGRPLPLRIWRCTGQVGRSEQLADRVAVELLAPAEALFAAAGEPPASDYWISLRSRSQEAAGEFGVPDRYLEQQIDALWRAAGGGPGFGDMRPDEHILVAFQPSSRNRPT